MNRFGQEEGCLLQIIYRMNLGHVCEGMCEAFRKSLEFIFNMAQKLNSHQLLSNSDKDVTLYKGYIN